MEILLLLPFVNNIVMSVIKWLGDNAIAPNSRNAVLRSVLAALSLVGVIAASFLNGTPVDPNQVSSLVIVILETVGVFVVSHFSYLIVKRA